MQLGHRRPTDCASLEGLGRSIRAKPSIVGKALTSAPGASSGRALASFLGSGDVLRVCVRAVTVLGWTDAQEKFERVADIVPVIAIESVRAIVDCELRSKTNVNAVAVR